MLAHGVASSSGCTCMSSLHAMVLRTTACSRSLQTSSEAQMCQSKIKTAKLLYIWHYKQSELADWAWHECVSPEQGQPDSIICGVASRENHGLGNLYRSRVQVGILPPAKNLYPRGRLHGLAQVFFSRLLHHRHWLKTPVNSIATADFLRPPVTIASMWPMPAVARLPAGPFLWGSYKVKQAHTSVLIGTMVAIDQFSFFKSQDQNVHISSSNHVYSTIVLTAECSHWLNYYCSSMDQLI